MKINSKGVSLSNKKKIALPTRPSSVLLKPKKFKSNTLKNRKNEGNKLLQLGIMNLKSFKTDMAEMKINRLKGIQLLQGIKSNSPNKGVNKRKSLDRFCNESPLIKNNIGLKQKDRPTLKHQQQQIVKLKKSKLVAGKLNAKDSSNTKKNKYINQGLLTNQRSIANQSKLCNKKSKQSDKRLGITSNLDLLKVTSAVTGLLKLVAEKSSNKAELLDLAEPIYLQVECIKIPICSTKQLRFKLPYPLVNDMADVLLITADKKGAKIYPEQAIEHYTELLAKHNVNFIQKVMPLKSVRDEYSQYEMRKKLVDQFDMILADATVIKCLPRLLGKFICYKRKMPIGVHLNRPNLKDHLQNAISKTQMTVKSNGHSSCVVVGDTRMKAEEIAANVVEVAKDLSTMYPGGWPNVRCLNIKTAKGIALPVYFSLVSSNEVRIPVELPKKRPLVEDELSTMPGTNVIVKPDGTVILKKMTEDKIIDDSIDDEIIQEAERYIQSSKTVRYGSDDDDENEDNDDDSDKEADAVTAAMEAQLLNSYGKKAGAKKTGEEEDDDDDEEDEEDEEEEDESSAGEDNIIPVPGKKRKLDSKKQTTSKSPVNKQRKSQQQPKPKGNTKNIKSGPMGDSGPKKRGTRGGKKNKMSKDQRKAMIKRKKAGKK